MILMKRILAVMASGAMLLACNPPASTVTTTSSTTPTTTNTEITTVGTTTTSTTAVGNNCDCSACPSTNTTSQIIPQEGTGLQVSYFKYNALVTSSYGSLTLHWIWFSYFLLRCGRWCNYRK